MTTQKSKLVLGTVQLGMKYGLNNTHGQPTKKESFAILDAALAVGITTFDTAYAYGTSEDILGAWIQERSLAGKVHIISKMKPHVLNDYPDGTKAADIVRRELVKSLQRLHVESLDGYLFHSPYYIYLHHMVEGLQKARDAGMVKNIGVSIYDEPEALQAVELGVDYVQVPYNAFDQRLDATDFFGIAKKNNVTVFARSPFLQGLVLMRPNQLPKHLSYIQPYLEQFIEIIGRYHLSPVQAALLFANEHCRADYIVFGVETLSQLKENIATVKDSASSLGSGWILEIENCFRNINHGAINLSLWSTIKR
ncbi:MAG: aldo/keto reductase [Minisyncoccia bacterium]|jgi:aryl-alcohol dehydrogenase-like predicted oxidoreductase